ncbi:MAG: DUF859 domain-containing protein [Clostridiales bacterium]|nr:DUF859 domain-containing protein [Clostridiales bacterium]
MAVSKTITKTASHGHHKYSLVVTETATSASANTSTISIKFTIAPVNTGYNWEDFSGSEQPKGTVTVDGTSYSWTLSDYNGSSTITLVSKTKTVEHSSDGTKSISMSFSCSSGSTSYLPGSASGSGTLALTTIARASSFSVSNGTIGTQQTITVTKKNSAYTHTITAKVGSKSQTICTKESDTTVSWTPAATLAQANTSGTSLSVTVTLQTYNGSTAIGDPVTKTVTVTIPSSIKAAITSVALSDAANLASTFGGYIQGKSKVKAVITANVSTSQAQGATVKKAEMTVDGATKSSTEADTSYTLTSSVLKTAGNQIQVVSQITDTRGRTSKNTQNISVLAYKEPWFNATPEVRRCRKEGQQYIADDSGDYCEVSYDARFTSLVVNNAEKNTTKLKITYKETGGTEQTAVAETTTLSGTTHFQADEDTAYTITITVWDTVGSTTVWTTQLSTASDIMNFSETGEAIGIGKIVDGTRKRKNLDVGWDLWVKDVNMTIDTTQWATLARKMGLIE